MQFLIIEDHPIVRQAICEKIRKVFSESEFVEIDHIDNNHDILDRCMPDFIIVDLELYGQVTLNTIEVLRNKFNKVPILVHSMYDDKKIIQQAIAAGANGYVTKYDSLDQIEQAIISLLKKKQFLSSRATEVMMKVITETKTKNESIDFEKVLTEREFQIFQLIGKDCSRKEISDQLNIAQSTVDSYFERLKKKLNVKRSHKLVCLAIKYMQIDS